MALYAVEENRIYGTKNGVCLESDADAEFSSAVPGVWDQRKESDANIRFDDICQLLQAKGFWMRVSGNHHIFTKFGVMERINLQREGSKAKPYQIRQVRKILAQYKLL